MGTATTGKALHIDVSGEHTGVRLVKAQYGCVTGDRLLSRRVAFSTV